MLQIPLEDNVEDILGKAIRGLKLNKETLCAESGVPLATLEALLKGQFDETAVRRLAPLLGLAVEPLVASGLARWYPSPPPAFDGLAAYNTPYGDMTVNAFLAWDPASKEAVAFDTGADASAMLATVREKGLRLTHVLLTHTHPDHIHALKELTGETGATAWVSDREPTPGASTFTAGRTFQVGGLTVSTRQTHGHSKGGTTYVVAGLDQPVAAVGDAMFAGSMGGGIVSYADAVRNNREQILTLDPATILCPGHGPLTTVGEQRVHNPFFPAT